MEEFINVYKTMLEQLNSGVIDERFFECVNFVYLYGKKAGEDIRNQISEDVCGSLKKQDNIGLTIFMYSYLLRLNENPADLE